MNSSDLNERQITSLVNLMTVTNELLNKLFVSTETGNKLQAHAITRIDAVSASLSGGSAAVGVQLAYIRDRLHAALEAIDSVSDEVTGKHSIVRTWKDVTIGEIGTAIKNAWPLILKLVVYAAATVAAGLAAAYAWLTKGH